VSGSGITSFIGFTAGLLGSFLEHDRVQKPNEKVPKTFLIIVKIIFYEV